MDSFARKFTWQTLSRTLLLLSITTLFSPNLTSIYRIIIFVKWMATVSNVEELPGCVKHGDILHSLDDVVLQVW